MVPTVRISWAGQGTWHITGTDGNKNHVWLLFGPIEKDGLEAWQFIVWRLHIAFGWP